MKSYKLIIILALGFFTLDSYGQEFKQLQPQFQGQIKVEVGAPAVDSLIVMVFKPYGMFIDRTDFIVKPSMDGKFRFRGPYGNLPSKILVQVVFDKGKAGRLNQYFVEAEDNISIDLISKVGGLEVFVSGKGAAKYNLVDSLMKFKETYNNLFRDLGLAFADGLSVKLENLDSAMMKLLARKKEILSSFALDNRMHRIIDYEYADLVGNWDFLLYNSSIKPSFKNEESRRQLRDYFNGKKEQFKFSQDSLRSLCPNSLAAFSFRNKLEIILSGNNDQADLKEYYSRVSENCTDPMKSQLLANIFLGVGGLFYLKTDQDAYDSLRIEAAKAVSIPSLKKNLLTRVRLSKGVPFFQTSFIDLNGKKISTSSLKGKVVFIDVWGNGCGNCAVFHQMFKSKVYPKLKDRKDFVVLSISEDRKKEIWQKGISSDKYSSFDYLNVYTGGMGADHPFHKYYNITGVPFYLLIDKQGKIFSTFKDARSADKFIEIINQAFESR